jgi:hypothetical protein
MTNDIKPDVPAIDDDADLDLTIEELDDVSAGLKASTFACVACPYSCFSSIMD